MSLSPDIPEGVMLFCAESRYPAYEFLKHKKTKPEAYASNFVHAFSSGQIPEKQITLTLPSPDHCLPVHMHLTVHLPKVQGDRKALVAAAAAK